MTFQSAKEDYERQREQEQCKLMRYLQAHTVMDRVGLKVSSGKGRIECTFNKSFAEYDLQNWGWVECKSSDGGFRTVISLNMSETDMTSDNTHCFFDRICLLILYKADGNSYFTSIYTGIDLPLSENSMEEIAAIVLQQFAVFRVLTGDRQKQY